MSHYRAVDQSLLVSYCDAIRGILSQCIQRPSHLRTVHSHPQCTADGDGSADGCALKVEMAVHAQKNRMHGWIILHCLLHSLAMIHFAFHLASGTNKLVSQTN